MEIKQVLPCNKSSQISYEDYSRMHIQTKKLNSYRRSPAPAWMSDSEKITSVLVSYLEKRAAKATTGTLAERLKAAEAACTVNSETKLRTLNKLSAKYVKAKRVKRRKRLEIQIRNLDADLFATKRGIAPLVLRAAFLFWRCGLTSPETAAELGSPVHPPCVRQWCHRLQSVARGLGYV